MIIFGLELVSSQSLDGDSEGASRNLTERMVGLSSSESAVVISQINNAKCITCIVVSSKDTNGIDKQNLFLYSVFLTKRSSTSCFRKPSVARLQVQLNYMI